MVVVGLFAAGMSSVFFAGFTDYLAPQGGTPDPATQPIEIVVSAERCLLNDFTVAPGKHEVVIASDDAGYRVLMSDTLGKVLFSAVTEPQKEPVVFDAVRLDVGTYRVECRGAGKTNVTELLVSATT